MTVWTELCWEKLLSGTTSGVAIWLNYCLWCCLGMVFMKRAEFHVWIGHQWRSQRFYNSGGTWVYCPFPPQHKKKLPTPNEGRKKYCTRQKILRENKALTQRRNKTRWPNRTALLPILLCHWRLLRLSCTKWAMYDSCFLKAIVRSLFFNHQHVWIQEFRHLLHCSAFIFKLKMPSADSVSVNACLLERNAVESTDLVSNLALFISGFFSDV